MKRHTIANVGLAALGIAAGTVVPGPTTPTEQTQRNDDHTAATPTSGVNATGTTTNGEEG